MLAIEPGGGPAAACAGMAVPSSTTRVAARTVSPRLVTDMAAPFGVAFIVVYESVLAGNRLFQELARRVPMRHQQNRSMEVS
ncbi:hypothetical protein Dsi01nite_029270 [Dactylosporangium siamense]|uniref:Uncharacterized protein n=1 Tax=Dactylosporangium siamense TaxID=685454 RepID=A0A919PKH4_9ACTN|nr:hypothetical protein Dsi01nite_029270 [Dactylosporangium siamense]